MKNIFSKLLTVLAVLTVSGCANEIPPVVDELQLGRCLSPSEVTAVIEQGEYVQFNWDKSAAADLYVVEIYKDELLKGEPIVLEIPKNLVPYTAHLEADMVYYYRVKAVSNREDIDDSRWTEGAKAIQTSAIKPSLKPELVGRTSTSISIKWQSEPQDLEVDHIRVTPALNSADEYTRIDVSGEEAKAAAKEVTGLKPSVLYTLTVHFKSAERGSVTEWTKPDMSGTTFCKDTAAIKQAIRDKAPKIRIPYADTTYVVGKMTIDTPLAIYGEDGPEGQHPVIAGDFSVETSLAEANPVSLYCECISFSGLAVGDGTQRTHLVNIPAAGKVGDVSFLNCDISGYQRGILYDNNKAAMQAGAISFDHCLICDILDGTGGDAFDIRQSSTIGKIMVTNSTISTGMRTFFRIDKATMGDFIFSHNTVDKLCTIKDSNNNGLLHIRGKVTGTFAVTYNLFLNMEVESQLIGHNASAIMPDFRDATKYGKNFFYNNGDQFYQHTVSSAETFGKELAVSNGGAILASDPCDDSSVGSFYVTNAAVKAAGAGDPRWLVPVPEPEPEDLTQNVTAPVHTWNFADTKTFHKWADKDMVRDGIRFYVKALPVTFDAAGPVLSSAAVVSGGVPVDCGMSIKVNQPGSIVVSTASVGDDQAMLTVNLDGKAIQGVPVDTENRKITFADIEAGTEHMIYLYGTSSIQITYLQWNDDVESGDKKLETPVVTQDKTSVKEGDNDKIGLTWDAVKKAGSYDITIDGEKKANVSTCAYDLETKSMKPGDYILGVVALPAAEDKTREHSDTAFVSFSVIEVLKPVTGDYIWGAEYMNAGVTKYGNGTELTADFIYGNLGYVAGGGKFKFGVDSELPRVQLGGTGTAGTKCNIQFIAGGAGTLKITARSGGDSARKLAVAIGSTDVDAIDTPVKTSDPAELTYDLSSAKSGDMINIYSKSSGINIYKIEWVAATVAPTVTMVNVSDFEIGDITTSKTVSPVTFVASSSKKWTVDGNEKSWTNPEDSGDSFTFTKRAKSGGASDTTGRYIEVALKAGDILEVWFMSGSSSETRTISIMDGALDGSEIQTFSNDGKALGYAKYTYSGMNAKVVMKMNASINIFGVRVSNFK